MAAAKPSASSSSPIPKKTIQKAVAALLKWKETNSNSQSPKLLEQDEFLYLILTLKKIPPKPRVNPFKIPLPHPLFHPSSSRVCLILDDGPKSKLNKEAAEKRVKQEGVPVSTILKLSKLRADYKSFEAKRDLCDSYDLFLADKLVLPLLPKLLGKQFYKRKKIPIGLDLRLGGWKEQVESVIRSGLLFLGHGTCSVVRVARVSMPREEIVENVAAAVVGLVETVPKKWRSVRSLHLKLLESLSLPVYQFRIEGSKGGHEGGEVTVDEKEGSSINETLAQGKKKATKDARQMDIDLDEGDMDDDVDRKEFGDGEDEEVDVGNWGGGEEEEI
ncbi:hypothetical protein MLD38_033279 [Melastoma candidum]|uniref:Uncharacterized protein n=1 Tax=Melastoma candidum TaxID=119954 RepID=A0ACB9M7J1_9MYRT|nr:hypothetical protein MLD38_033279 [Melastoma candidum]